MLGGIYCTYAVDIRVLQRRKKNREKIVVPEVHVCDSQCVQETDQWSVNMLFIPSFFTENRCFRNIFKYILLYIYII